MKTEIFEFLKTLQQNNNRPWFQEHKEWYETAKSEAYQIFLEIEKGLFELDSFQPPKFYRIYRDLRFSKDKTPYNSHFSVMFQRKKPENRGGFYVKFKPGESLVGGGFWGPVKEDMERIRTAIDLEDDLEKILKDPVLVERMGEIQGERLKRIPKGFDPNHPRKELLGLKQFLFVRPYSDEEVIREDFVENVLKDYEALRPFFQYMTEVLTTNENGEPLWI